MTRLLDEGFESGTDGDVASTLNTTFSSFAGNTPQRTIASSAKLFESKGLRFDIGATDVAYGQYVHSVLTTAYLRFYMYMSAATVTNAQGQLVLFGVLSSGTYRCQVTQGPNNGKINIRQNQTLRATTANEYFGKWVRFEYDVVEAVQTLRLYSGANLHGTTPDETLTGANNTGGFDRLRLGFCSTPGVTDTMLLDAVAYDTVSQPGPLAAPVGGPAPYVWDGSAWVKKNTISVWGGSTWVDKTTITVY